MMLGAGAVQAWETLARKGGVGRKGYAVGAGCKS